MWPSRGRGPGEWGEGSYLGEEEIELLAVAVVTTLREEELHLFLHLLLVQVPAVLILHTGPSRGVRGSCTDSTNTVLLAAYTHQLLTSFTPTTHCLHWCPG